MKALLEGCAYASVQVNCIPFTLNDEIAPSKLMRMVSQNLEGNQPTHIAAKNDDVEALKILCLYDKVELTSPETRQHIPQTLPLFYFFFPSPPQILQPGRISLWVGLITCTR